MGGKEIFAVQRNEHLAIVHTGTIAPKNWCRCGKNSKMYRETIQQRTGINKNSSIYGLYLIYIMPDTTFIGNVLPPEGHEPEGDKTFDFTTTEAKNLDLTGVPIRIEHADSLAIGTVTKQWTKPNGEKWIMGKIEDKGLASSYAAHAIKPDSRGHTLYKGLSLQHVHQQWSDGTSAKRPVEVSICTEPRRPECYIRAISETEKNEYIHHKASGKSDMSAPVQNTDIEQVPSQVSDAVGTPAPELSKPGDEPETAPVQSQEVKNALATANSQEELYKMFLKQDQENQTMEAQMKKLTEEKTALEAKWKEREDNEILQTKSKAEALSHALVESWQKTLAPGDMTEENKKAIYALAHKFPEESVQMMEIAHKASVKHRNDRDMLSQTEANANKRVLEQQVVDTIMKRRRGQDAPVEIVQQASIKSKPVVASFNPFAQTNKSAKETESFGQNNTHLFSAMKGLSSGNAKSMMDQIANYRNKM